MLYPDGFGGLHYFPDEPISVLSISPWRFLMVAANHTVLMEGPTLETAKPIMKVLEPGAGAAFDNGYAGIASVCQVGDEWLAFYHGEDHLDVRPIEYNTAVPGFYAAAGLAVSRDGRTFEKAGQILSAALKKGEVQRSAQGLGDVSVCVDQTNTYLYAYFTDLTREGGRPVLIGMARCKRVDRGRAGTWHKYFEGAFGEVGLGGKSAPVVRPPAEVHGDAWGPHVSYSKELKKYLMFFTVTAYADQEQTKATQTGVYFASSDDGICWSKPSVVFLMQCLPRPGREIAMHPAFYPSTVAEKKLSGWLIYGYSPRFGGTPPRVPHYAVRRAITLELTE